jgi:hypothetical protein
MLKYVIVALGLTVSLRAQETQWACSPSSQYYDSDFCRGLRGDPPSHTGPATLRPAPRTTQVVAPHAARAPQDLTPVSPSILPPTAPFWRVAPQGAQMTIGIRPQFLTSSPFMEQILRAGGSLAAGGMDEFRKESQGVDLIVISTRVGQSPLILARGADVIHATKAENDPLRYLDPQTIVVGDPNETRAAIGRIVSAVPASNERFLASVAPWSDVWLTADAAVLNKFASGRAALPGVVRFTMGMAVRAEITTEVWLETLSPYSAKLLLAKLNANPQSAPFVEGMPGAQTAIEQVDSAVRIYARLRPAAGQVSPQAAPQANPAAAAAPAPAPAPAKRKTAVIQGLDDGPREVQLH